MEKKILNQLKKFYKPALEQGNASKMLSYLVVDNAGWWVATDGYVAARVEKSNLPPFTILFAGVLYEPRPNKMTLDGICEVASTTSTQTDDLTSENAKQMARSINGYFDPSTQALTYSGAVSPDPAKLKQAMDLTGMTTKDARWVCGDQIFYLYPQNTTDNSSDLRALVMGVMNCKK